MPNLLDKVLAVKPKKSGRAPRALRTMEDIDVAVRCLKGEFPARKLQVALGKGHNTGASAAVNWVYTTLMFAMRNNLIRIEVGEAVHDAPADEPTDSTTVEPTINEAELANIPF